MEFDRKELNSPDRKVGVIKRLQFLGLLTYWFQRTYWSWRLRLAG